MPVTVPPGDMSTTFSLDRLVRIPGLWVQMQQRPAITRRMNKPSEACKRIDIHQPELSRSDSRLYRPQSSSVPTPILEGGEGDTSYEALILLYPGLARAFKN